jgi:hypothetical protein
MLEAFEILTTSGVVLWSKSYASVGSHVVNSLINDVFIEEKAQLQNTATGASPIFKKEKYTLKWRRSKDFNLIFVVRVTRPILTQSGAVACSLSVRPFTNRFYILDGLISFWITFRLSLLISTRTS